MRFLHRHRWRYLPYFTARRFCTECGERQQKRMTRLGWRWKG